MNYKIIEARIRRSKIKQLTGTLYQDQNSSIIKEFNKKGCDILFGIKSQDNEYTLIGERKIYYSSNLGKESQLDLASFTEILKENAMRLRKGGDFKYIEIENENFIWVHNGSVMSAIWNIVLLIKEQGIPPRE